MSSLGWEVVCFGYTSQRLVGSQRVQVSGGRTHGQCRRCGGELYRPARTHANPGSGQKAFRPAIREWGGGSCPQSSRAPAPSWHGRQSRLLVVVYKMGLMEANAGPGPPRHVGGRRPLASVLFPTTPPHFAHARRVAAELHTTVLLVVRPLAQTMTHTQPPFPSFVGTDVFDIKAWRTGASKPSARGAVQQCAGQSSCEDASLRQPPLMMTHVQARTTNKLQ